VKHPVCTYLLLPLPPPPLILISLLLPLGHPSNASFKFSFLI
jgi:hypothetical protein